MYTKYDDIVKKGVKTLRLTAPPIALEIELKNGEILKMRHATIRQMYDAFVYIGQKSGCFS